MMPVSHALEILLTLALVLHVLCKQSFLHQVFLVSLIAARFIFKLDISRATTCLKCYMK